MNVRQSNINNVPGFSSLLTILFIALKLTGYITWPWYLVLAPIWISIGIGVACFILLALLLGRRP